MNAPIERILTPLQRFLKAEAAGGILLLIATAIALVWANSGLSASYRHLWETPLTIGVGDAALSKALILWINDGLMAIFFFVVGLEIKREVLIGELSSVRKAILPVAAAIGGMAGPAVIFAIVNNGTPTAHGWGVPMATDIAFAVGLLALLGRSVPIALKVFLVALAIVDDIGAVTVIAIFYTDSIKWNMLGMAAATFVVLGIVNRLGIRNLIVYSVLGVLMWFLVLKSGVHATIAGVLLALTIPSTVRLKPGAFPGVVRAALERLDASKEDLGSSELDQAIVHDLEQACEAVESPLLRLEHALVPWVAFVIMPVFALANAGVDVRGFAMGDLLSPVSIGIAAGLFFGNQIGVVGLSWIAVRLRLCDLPDGVTWRQIHGASLLAGIGFTMSLFISGLAFAGSEAQDISKIAILIGSTTSGVVGLAVLWGTRPRSGR